MTDTQGYPTRIKIAKGTQANFQSGYFYEAEPVFLTDVLQFGIVDSSNNKYILPRTVFVQTASTTLNNSTTETTLTNTGVGSLTHPANFFIAGKTTRIKAYGYLGDTGTPTLRIKFKLGSVVLIDTTAITLPTITGSKAWVAEATFTCRTTGASGTIQAQGYFSFDNVTVPFLMTVANTGTSTVDTTVTQAFTLTAQWGAADAANTITCTNLTLEALN